MLEISDPLLAKCPHSDMKPGQRLYGPGDPAETAFLLLAGRVEIRRGSGEGVAAVQRIRPGRLFGAVDFLARRARVNEAVCTRAARVLIVPEELIRERLAETDPFLQAVLRISCERLSALRPELW